MTALPVLNAYRNAANQGVAKQAFEDLRRFVEEQPGGAAETTLTIAAGVVTPTLGEHAIDTEAAAVLDDLDTIALTNKPDGSLLLIHATDPAHFVRLRHNIGGDGKLLLRGGINFLLDGTSKWVLLKRSGVTWVEIFRSGGGWREALAANRTYYVRTDGNDANTGLVDSAAGAFLTVQKALDTIQKTLDLNGFVATVQLADGTYTVGAQVIGIAVGQIGPQSIVIQGNNASPGNVVISVTGNSAITGAVGAQFTVKDLELRTITSGQALFIQDPGAVVLFSNIRFGVCAGVAHMLAQRGAGIIAIGNYAITGAAARHIYVESSGVIDLRGRTVTITGTPAFTIFAHALDVATLYCGGMTFSGSATGTRYSATTNALINTNGGGANYLPGNAAGSTATGGLYV